VSAVDKQVYHRLRVERESEMDLDGDGAPARGLRRYVRLVADTLGLRGGGWLVQLESPVSAYVALQRRLVAYPGNDVALSWDEENGWGFAVESNQGELAILDYLADDVLPPPRLVGQFVNEVFSGQGSARPDPPGLRRVDANDDLWQRLAAYASRTSTLSEVMTASGNVPITVRVSHHDAGVVLRVIGELDMVSAPSLTESIADALREHPAMLVVDLTAVRFIASAGMSALVGAYDQAGDRTQVRVVASHPATLRPLEVTGLLTAISVHATVQSALEASDEARLRTWPRGIPR
jgi:anti-anti-sigma factor